MQGSGTTGIIQIWAKSIHDKLIEKVKEYLTTTNLSVSEITYQLSFEHSQSFNKLFRKKTRLTSVEFTGRLPEGKISGIADLTFKGEKSQKQKQT